MPFRGRSSSSKFTQIFYATDVHGSDRCFLKFTNAAKFYDVDVLILGGDLTGKMIVPIIEQPDGSFTSKFLGNDFVSKSSQDLADLETSIRNSGLYPYRTNGTELKQLQADKSKITDLFQRLMIERLQNWVNLAEERLRETKTKMYITGGNDDPLAIEDVMRGPFKHIIDPEGSVIQIDEYHEMVSAGYSNMTPWNCPRDISEEELARKIESSVMDVKDMKTAIFNFHVPPVDSGLDTAPKLDTSVDPPKPIVRSGKMVMFGAGSTAVRNAIEKYQPLLGLHGHIHESSGVMKIGNTLCINPGSEYGEGILRGVIVTLSRDGVESYQLTQG